MRWPSPSIFLVALVVGGCGEATSPQHRLALADLAGHWTLTAWAAVSVADTSERLDLLAQLNATATIDIDPDGGAIFTASVYGQAPTVQHATLSLSGDTLVYHELTGDTRFVLGVSRDRMHWRGVIPQFQDVNGDGKPEETRTWMDFARS